MARGGRENGAKRRNPKRTLNAILAIDMHPPKSSQDLSSYQKGK
jgi:hypothetical protein